MELRFSWPTNANWNRKSIYWYEKVQSRPSTYRYLFKFNSKLQKKKHIKQNWIELNWKLFPVSFSLFQFLLFLVPNICLYIFCRIIDAICLFHWFFFSFFSYTVWLATQLSCMVWLYFSSSDLAYHFTIYLILNLYYSLLFKYIKCWCDFGCNAFYCLICLNTIFILVLAQMKRLLIALNRPPYTPPIFLSFSLATLNGLIFNFGNNLSVIVCVLSNPVIFSFRRTFDIKCVNLFAFLKSCTCISIAIWSSLDFLYNILKCPTKYIHKTPRLKW